MSVILIAAVFVIIAIVRAVVVHADDGAMLWSLGITLAVGAAVMFWQFG